MFVIDHFIRNIEVHLFMDYYCYWYGLDLFHNFVESFERQLNHQQLILTFSHLNWYLKFVKQFFYNKRNMQQLQSQLLRQQYQQQYPQSFQHLKRIHHHHHHHLHHHNHCLFHLNLKKELKYHWKLNQ